MREEKWETKQECDKERECGRTNMTARKEESRTMKQQEQDSVSVRRGTVLGPQGFSSLGSELMSVFHMIT